MPETDYKIVYKPPIGLKQVKWRYSDAAIAMVRAMDMPFKEFVRKVTTQVQWTKSLLVASTVLEKLVERLTTIPQLQVGCTSVQGCNVYKFVPYLKSLPNKSA